MTETRIAQYRCGNGEHVTFAPVYFICIDTVHTKCLLVCRGQDHDTDVVHQGPINSCIDGLAISLGEER